MKPPFSVTDGKRSRLESRYRRRWPYEKPHIYLSKTGWRVRVVEYRRVKVYGPFETSERAFASALVVWLYSLHYLNVRRSRDEN